MSPKTVDQQTAALSDEQRKLLDAILTLKAQRSDMWARFEREGAEVRDQMGAMIVRAIESGCSYGVVGKWINMPRESVWRIANQYLEILAE